jgi:hypothetical protein
MPAICAERQPEPLGGRLLLWNGVEIGQIEDPVEPMVALIGKQALRGFSQKRLQNLRGFGG